MKINVKQEDLICIELDSRAVHKLCGVKPWIDVLREKIDIFSANKPVSIYTNISFFNKIILKILRIKPLAESGGEILISYTESLGSENEKIIVKLDQNDWFNIYGYRLPRLLALPLSELKRVFIYLAVNTTGIAVNLLVVVATYYLLMSYIYDILLRSLSSLMGFEASVVYNFTLHEIVTFKGTGLDRSPKGVFNRLMKYHFASILSLLSQISMANILPVAFGLEIWLAQFIGIIVGFIINFIFGYIYTWSRYRVN